MKKLMRLFKDDEGASMVEYGLLVALIAVVAIAGIILVGEDLLALFNNVAAQL